MGIEELINKYKKEIHNYEKYIDGQWACEIDRISGMKIAVEVLKDTIKDIKQLKSSLPTQPELVEVPKVTGVMIDHFKRGGFSLHESLNVHVNVPNILSLVYKEFREWLTAYDYATKEDIFARAWLNGWTEEKERLYYVVFPNVETNGYDSWLMKMGDGTFELADNNDFESMQFTEKEIKAIDERYWAFAVPVEEE